MHAILNRVLFAIAAAIVGIDAVWVIIGHFAIDVRNYAMLLLLVPPLAGGAMFYSRVRHEPALSATLAASAYLIVFSAGCCLLSYLALTVAGPRIDGLLAAIDHAMGFSWPAVMTLASDHRVITAFLGFAYLSVMPQIVLLILVLGWQQRLADLYGLCLALSLGALVAVAVWTLFPSFGAFSVFDLPHTVSAKLGLALDGDYGRDLVAMLKNGPGFITPKELRGIIGFPSYHTVQALVLIWYARNIPWLRWAALALNVLVLMATPIHGGHHLIDLVGGAVVAWASIALAGRIVGFAERRAQVSAPLSALGPDQNPIAA
jgi:PAP2 superfamily